MSGPQEISAREPYSSGTEEAGQQAGEAICSRHSAIDAIDQQLNCLKQEADYLERKRQELAHSLEPQQEDKKPTPGQF